MAGQETVWGWMWVYTGGRRGDELEVIPYFEAFPTRERARAHLQRHLDDALPDAPAAKAAPMLRVAPEDPVVVRCPPDMWIVFEVPPGATVDGEAAAYVERNREALLRELGPAEVSPGLARRIRDNALVVVGAVVVFGLAVFLGPFLLVTSLFGNPTALVIGLVVTVTEAVLVAVVARRRARSKV
ncbi:hypothetical protein [Amycolatopsis samaneae]|uniref:Uncharacterized protein n=1 Tax=Amycolatopsis samaneae TaxID=664691 RepID=A0ABW5GPU0_9PSEU